MKYYENGKLITKNILNIGDKYNEWTIISLPYKKQDMNNPEYFRTYYRCRCKCGIERENDQYHLTHGRSRMCRKCSANISSYNTINIRDKYNDWTIISPSFKKGKITYYNCRCKCGTIKQINQYNLTHGRSRMCRKCSAKLVGMFRKNDNPQHWLYSKWQGIKSRCYNKNQIKSYKYYGALGIKMHDPW